VGSEYEDFLADLGREKRPTSPAAEAGIAFENMVCRFSRLATCKEPSPEEAAAMSFGQRLLGAAYQVKAMKPVEINGLPINLVGIADFIKAGIITDIKRVQRYEYGKYQFSAQHPMYLELWPEALRFDYLIWDGSYSYMEQYRRNDCESILDIGSRFLRYLEQAELMDIYQSKWKEKE